MAHQTPRETPRQPSALRRKTIPAQATPLFRWEFPRLPDDIYLLQDRRIVAGLSCPCWRQ